MLFCTVSCKAFKQPPLLLCVARTDDGLEIQFQVSVSIAYDMYYCCNLAVCEINRCEYFANCVDLQVNHLSPLLITLELLPIILDSASSSGDARIVLVSSRAHEQGVWNPPQFNPATEEQFSRLRGYPHTKMQNVRNVKD